MEREQGDPVAQALRIARAAARLRQAGLEDPRESIADKVRRWSRLRSPDLPAWARELREHDSHWQGLYAAEATRLRTALGEARIAALEHIGSSAIPHLASKPSLDLLLAVREPLPSAPLAALLVSLGYEPYGTSPCDREAEWLWRPLAADCLAVLHVCAADNPWLRTATNFRDYLTAHPAECRRYGELKHQLAAEGRGMTLLEYSLRKLELFYELSAKADGWATGAGSNKKGAAEAAPPRGERCAPRIRS